jgi:hypothetical protein
MNVGEINKTNCLRLYTWGRREGASRPAASRGGGIFEARHTQVDWDTLTGSRGNTATGYVGNRSSRS